MLFYKCSYMFQLMLSHHQAIEKVYTGFAWMFFFFFHYSFTVA
jgi:hypothetical protein